MAAVDRKIVIGEIMKWVRNTTLSADKLAAYFGVSKELVQAIIDEERK